MARPRLPATLVARRAPSPSFNPAAAGAMNANFQEKLHRRLASINPSLTMIRKCVGRGQSRQVVAPMEIVWSLVLMYLALGAAFFAHPREQAELNDFHWKGQLSIFF